MLLIVFAVKEHRVHLPNSHTEDSPQPHAATASSPKGWSVFSFCTSTRAAFPNWLSTCCLQLSLQETCHVIPITCPLKSLPSFCCLQTLGKGFPLPANHTQVPRKYLYLDIAIMPSPTGVANRNLWGKLIILGRVWKQLTLFWAMSDHVPCRCKCSFDHLWEKRTFNFWSVLPTLPASSMHAPAWKPPQRPSSFRAVGKSLPNPPMLSLGSSHLGDITGMIRLKTLFPTEDNWHYSGQETIANKTMCCVIHSFA